MGQKLALIIATADYQDTGLARLIAPGLDAHDFAGALKSAEIGAFDGVQVLFNEAEALTRRAIARFFSARKPDDLLLLYFSGHGVRDDLGQLYLAVSDTDRSLLSATAIPANFINEQMNASRSRRQVLILDCCNSGAFAQGSKAALGASMGIATAFEGTGYGRVVLTATDATQYAWEGDQALGEAANSVFTHFLVKGLETGAADADNDGRITLDELYDYVYEQVVTQTPRQTPRKFAYNQQGEVVIAHNPRPALGPAELPPELRQAVESSLAGVREAAVRELAGLLRGTFGRGLALAAAEALERLTSDDSRRVSAAAAETLAANAEAQRQAQADAARRDLEEAEKLLVARQQMEAQQRAAAELAAAEKAAADKAVADKAAADQLAAEKAAEQERQIQARLEEERRAAEQAEAEQAAAAKAAQDRLDRERAEAARQAQAKAAQEEAARQRAAQAERDRLAREQAASEKAAAEKAEAERQAAAEAQAKSQAPAAGAAEQKSPDEITAQPRRAEVEAAQRLQAEHRQRAASETPATPEDLNRQRAAQTQRIEQDRIEARLRQAQPAKAQPVSPVRPPAQAADKERLAKGQAEAQWRAGQPGHASSSPPAPVPALAGAAAHRPWLSTLVLTLLTTLGWRYAGVLGSEAQDLIHDLLTSASVDDKVLEAVAGATFGGVLYTLGALVVCALLAILRPSLRGWRTLLVVSGCLGLVVTAWGLSWLLNQTGLEDLSPLLGVALAGGATGALLAWAALGLPTTAARWRVFAIVVGGWLLAAAAPLLAEAFFPYLIETPEKAALSGLIGGGITFWQLSRLDDSSSVDRAWWALLLVSAGWGLAWTVGNTILRSVMDILVDYEAGILVVPLAGLLKYGAAAIILVMALRSAQVPLTRNRTLALVVAWWAAGALGGVVSILFAIAGTLVGVLVGSLCVGFVGGVTSTGIALYKTPRLNVRVLLTVGFYWALAFLASGILQEVVIPYATSLLIGAVAGLGSYPLIRLVSRPHARSSELR